ncbi:FAD-binding and (Fe-S)-binding domain-containing protein [Actinocatenispora rupis]|uniref:Lactate dehydrogenase n=1 Tax=Actinocatenispora rupis TaxID=519421 RepID=A0A8J3NAP8_9ACTN|nr:FAD-binding and (Fe-S)-binding domain-containing protein [Actinocatenispora rupis]GID09787.1 lactate dehydrogenase [Actinocatenispora rupis]
METVTGLVDGLRRAGVREVDTSTRRRAEYSSDASLYRVPPEAVVFPRDDDEVAATLAVCREQGVPLTSRGAGTSIAGNAVGPGVVLDFSRHLNQVLAVDPDARTARVRPGLVLDALQRELKQYGLRFGPEPSTHSRCTFGGMIGNNSCGSRALAYGKTSDNVVDLDVLAGTGERLTATRGADPASSPVLTSVHEAVRAHLATIRTELGTFDRQVSGYSLEHLLPENDFDVARALVGTEGGCAVLLGATVSLVESPAAALIVVLGYPDMAAAADAVPALLPYRPTSLEGMDHRIVDAVRGKRGDSAVPALPGGQGWLFLELGGASVAELLPTARQVIADAGAVDSEIVTDPGQQAALWKIREAGAALSQRSTENKPAYAGWEDAAVPPAKLGAYLREFDALMADRGLSGMPYGHFGDGCVHVRVDYPLTDGPSGVRVFRDFLTDAARLVASYGGSMSGEHGDGRARGELLPLMYSPAALAAFAAVKDAFDPDGVLNPGVIVRPAPLDADLRVAQAPPVRTGLGFTYPHDHGDLTTAVHRCTGVGVCRADNTGSGGVMCPSYVATRDEKDSTRGRSRVLQEAINGTLVSGLRSPEVRESLDLCLSCKGCSSDCPAGVDMATYKAEVLHQTYRRRVRPASHYTLGWLPRWARLAAHAPALANAALRAPGLSTVAKRFGGIDARRSLPSFARTTFRRWFERHRPQSTDGDPVLLWVDTFTDHFTPEVGVAAVRVLEDAGFTVRLPRRGLCCGLTWISTGQLDAAKRILGRSVGALAPAAADGVPIVGLEPSCTAVFRGDAPDLLGDKETSAVSGAFHTLAELLTRHRPQWTPPDLTGTTVVAQPHCHQHAVMGWETDRALLAAAGAEVTAAGGCCGLAGNFGVERGHYEVSVQVAESALFPAVRAAGEDATVLADGFSCRTQLDDLLDRRGVHLAELLAAKRS